MLHFTLPHTWTKVYLLGIIKMRPKRFLPQCNDPYSQIVRWIFLYPLWCFNDRLATACVIIDKKHRLLKRFFISSISNEWKKCRWVLNQVSRYCDCVFLLFIRSDLSILDDSSLKFSNLSIATESVAIRTILLSLYSFKQTLKKF